MNIVPFFITNAQSSLIEQPIKRYLDNITEFAKTTAVLGIPFSNQRFNLTPPQRLANLLFSIVGTIREYFVRTPARAALRLLDGRDSVNQSNRYFRIVNIGSGMFNRQRDSIAVNNQMTLIAVFAPIRGIWTCFRPPKSARTEQLSMAETDQSITSAIPNSSSSDCHIFCQIPAVCQSRRRHQQVMPLPHPISRGRYLPGGAGLENKQDASQTSPVADSGPTAFGFGRFRWNLLFDMFP